MSTAEHPRPDGDDDATSWLLVPDEVAAFVRRLRPRPTKPQVAALLLLTLFSLGPLVALAVVLRSPPSPTDELVAGIPVPADGAQLDVTVVSVSPSAGEMRVRFLLLPRGSLVSGGDLTSALRLRVNNANGQVETVFPAGTTPTAVEASIALTGGDVNRYPFDSYDAVVLAAVGIDGGEGVPTVPHVVSAVSDFTVKADVATPYTAGGLVGVSFALTRSGTTTVYASSMMLLMWGLAIGGVLIAWAVIMRRAETPFWAFGYAVGVLFALPQLRDSLPGRPPPGTLLDYVAFYWSIAIVGITLLLFIAVWVRRTQARMREADLEEQVSVDGSDGVTQ